MPIRKIFYLLFYFKWHIIIPMCLAPVMAVGMLLFVEPVYISSCKIWTKEHMESSKLLKVQRSGMQESTFVEVQRQIILSERVLMKVIDQCNLIDPPPSQTIFAKIFKPKKKTNYKLTADERRIEALKALRNSTGVNIINPEIITIDISMNTPQFAQKVLTVLIDAYRQEYLQIIINEVKEYRNFLASQLALIKELAAQKEEMLNNFEEEHPEYLIEASAMNILNVSSASLEFAQGVGDFSPVPEILKELAKLELLKIRASVRYEKDSSKMRELDELIKSNKKLLNKYTQKLSGLSKVAMRHESLKWELLEIRRQLSLIDTEYYQILISEGSKVKQISNIVVLDEPEIERIAVYPKKKMTVIAAMFLGVIFGLGLVYLRIFLDGTYHLPEDLIADTKLPVLLVTTVDKKGRRR